MKFLFNYKIIVRKVIWLSMGFKILFHHLVRYVASTPFSIADCPKVSPPVSFLEFWKFFLQPSRTPSFQSLNQITNRFRRWIFNMDVHLIFAHHSFQDFDIFRLANLSYQIPASLLKIPSRTEYLYFVTHTMCNVNLETV